MKTSEKNLITEINRIHQLMGVKKLITESRKILVPLLQIAQEIVEYAAKRNLDDATQRAVSELKTGTKGLVDADGNPIPLKAEDYVRIFDNLKKSTDTGIIAKMAEIDQKIVSAIQDNISELITPDIKTLIKQYIDSGANEDFVVKELQKIFKNTSYGKYADFTTVVDDAGRAVETLLDDYLREIRKVYVDLGGKLDDVVVDGGRGSIAREIVEISPVFIRYTNEVGKKMKPLLDEVMELIELRTSTEVDPTRLDELDKEIKTLMERIDDINSEYVEALESQIKYGMEFGPVEDRARWADINKYISDVKNKYGDWGVTKASTPQSELWIWIDKTWQGSLDFERSIGNFFSGIWNWKQTFAEAWTKGIEAAKKAKGIKEKITAYERDVDSDLATKVTWWQKHLIPGSSRGIPKPLSGPKGTKLYYPNAYGEIIKYSTKNKMVKAWLSLFAEKMIIVTKTQLYYSLIMPLYQLFKFWMAGKEVQKKYKDCITETSKAIKDGKIKWDDYSPESMTEEDFNKIMSEFPPCLQTLVKSPEFMKNEYEDFMTRAEFWSRGERGEILTSYFKDYLVAWSQYDFGRFFTGALGFAAIKFLPGFWDEFWNAEETGDLTQIEQYIEDQGEQLRADSIRIDTEADTLYQNMTDRDIEEAIRVLDSLEENSEQVIVPIPSRNQ